jgi:hypothetical protein
MMQCLRLTLLLLLLLPLPLLLLPGVSDAAVAGGGLGSVDPDDDAGLCGVLLQGCCFFLAREVPREPLLFMIR